jgi:hypothetical protein
VRTERPRELHRKLISPPMNDDDFSLSGLGRLTARTREHESKISTRTAELRLQVRFAAVFNLWLQVASFLCSSSLCERTAAKQRKFEEIQRQTAMHNGSFSGVIVRKYKEKVEC